MAGLMPAATGLTKDSPIDGLNSLGTTSVRDSLPRQGRRRPTLTVTGFDRGRNARPAPGFLSLNFASSAVTFSI